MIFTFMFAIKNGYLFVFFVKCDVHDKMLLLYRTFDVALTHWKFIINLVCLYYAYVKDDIKNVRVLKFLF